MLDNFTPDQISAFWDGVSGVATASAAVVAILSLLALRRDSADRSRPQMSADLRPVALSRGTSELVIENVGQSVAKNVQVTFEPPLPDLKGPEAANKVTPFLRRRYEHAIPTIPPGRQLYNVYSVGVPGSGNNLVNDEPTPQDVTVTISYENARGKRFVDSYELSLRPLQNETESSPSNTDEKGMQRRHIKALETIARALSRR
jgi:hypothetical protein